MERGRPSRFPSARAPQSPSTRTISETSICPPSAAAHSPCHLDERHPVRVGALPGDVARADPDADGEAESLSEPQRVRVAAERVAQVEQA